MDALTKHSKLIMWICLFFGICLIICRVMFFDLETNWHMAALTGVMGLLALAFSLAFFIIAYFIVPIFRLKRIAFHDKYG